MRTTSYMREWQWDEMQKLARKKRSGQLNGHSDKS